MSDQFLRSLDDIREEQEAILEREMDPDMALLSDYVSGELPAERAAEVRARIQNDPDFRDLAAPLLLLEEHGPRHVPWTRRDLERKWLELRRRIGLPELDTGAPQADAGMRAYRKQVRAEMRGAKRRALIGIAAMVLFMLAAPMYITWRKSVDRDRLTPWGNTHTVALTDGSRIVVSMGSRLDPRGTATGNGRAYQLRGEATFDIVPTPAPFLVFTESALVTVVGTSFTVHAYPGEPTQVSVRQGTVSVQPLGADGAPFGNQLRVAAGQRARIVRGFPAETVP